MINKRISKWCELVHCYLGEHEYIGPYLHNHKFMFEFKIQRLRLS